MSRTTQSELEFPEQPRWGGRRRNAGRRKRKGGVAHAPRESVSKHDPRLVTLKLARGLPQLRTKRFGGAITDCILVAQRRSFRIVHYSIQSNHLHMIVEADDRAALAGRFFDGWAGRAPDQVASAEGAIVAQAGWKILTGWKRYYAAIGLDELPVL